MAREIRYDNAGTIEFLYDLDRQEWFFIEMNPRIQVEHTVTEVITGLDLVRAQILIAQGHELHGPEVRMPLQDQVPRNGYAIQCRLTTEDPENKFMPDYGKILAYRSTGGFGIRLDGGMGYAGAVITPYYDSLLVKVVASAHEWDLARHRMDRALREFRIRGLKTNIPFLENVINNPIFAEGRATTTLVDNTPELYDFKPRRDRATKLLNFLGNVIVNGNPHAKGYRPGNGLRARQAAGLRLARPPSPRARATCCWSLGRRSSRSGRLSGSPCSSRTPPSATPTSRSWPRACAPMTCWPARRRSPAGWAHWTAVCSPWKCGAARPSTPPCGSCPKTPGNGCASFARPSRISASRCSSAGRTPSAIPTTPPMWSPGSSSMPPPPAWISSASSTRSTTCRTFGWRWKQSRTRTPFARPPSATPAISWTSAGTNTRSQYYVRMARELKRMGAHFLAIKDMAGLCRPFAARKLVKALKEEIGLPIHFHTHDTSGIASASVLQAGEAGAAVVDLAIASMSGSTSQPNLNSIVAALQHTPRDTRLDLLALNEFSDYWEKVREYYAPFDVAPKTGSADVYLHEMPGGQYTNLREQAASMGVARRWPEIARLYAEVNLLFGDIVKVTPSSKVVGDMALFLFSRGIRPEDVANLEPGVTPFPESVIDMLDGGLGWPPGGWPEPVWRVVLGEERFLSARKRYRAAVAQGDAAEGAGQPGADLEKLRAELSAKLKRPASDDDLYSHLMYPQVFAAFDKHRQDLQRCQRAAHPRQVLRPAAPRGNQRGYRARQDPDHPVGQRERAGQGWAPDGDL